MSKPTFDQVELSPALLATLDSLNYTHMTPIQALSLPAILKHRDVIGQGKTGSGKTAAFGLGVLSNLNVKRFRVQSLVLCPTRELADQVAKEIRTLGRSIHNIKVLTLCGGMPMGPQIGSLEHGAHILVGTPGRILDHLEKGRINLEELNTLVLDEADRMLDMGFQDALDAIIAKAPKQRQTLLFSATFPEKIEQVAKRIMQSPELIKVESTHDTSSIVQYFYRVEGSEARDEALANLLLTHQPESAVVFCNTKKEVQSVADELHRKGFSVIDIHGDLEQRERDQALVQFSNKSVSILVATDVAARGLDVDNLDAVFNFELSRDPEVHVHRIGRTGRAGSTGLAFSFFGEKDGLRVARIEEYLEMDVVPTTLPAKSNQQPYQAKMVTINIDGGKRQKVRPGDILGCLTGKGGIPGTQVGKIHLFPVRAYVAVEKSVAKKALQTISNGKMKGRQFRARILK